jgi:hypothetical protein
MAKAILPQVNEKDLQLMRVLVAEGHIQHKYAVRLQTVLNRANGESTNTVASILGIDINSVSNHGKRHNCMFTFFCPRSVNLFIFLQYVTFANTGSIICIRLEYWT